MPIDQKYIGYSVDIILLTGISFLLVVSFSAAFIFDSPFRSPFSDFVNFVFQMFPSKPIPTFIFHQPVVLWRTVGVILVAMLMLAAGGYFVQKQNYLYFVFVFYAIACVFALMRKGRETDMQPRCFNLPQWVLFSGITIFVGFTAAGLLSNLDLTLLSILFFVVTSISLSFMGYIGIKLSETRPMVAEVEAISWLLKKSSNKDPALFKKAVQIAGQSPNARALFVQKLLPLLLPLIISLPKQGDVTDEQKGYINTLAILMDFTPQRRSFWCNEASLERPALPEELVERLETLRTSKGKCSHREGTNQEQWNDGTLRCPEGCVSNAADHILRLHESDNRKDREKHEKLKSTV